MATRSRSHTPPTTSHSPEEEVQEAGFSPQQDDRCSFNEASSLLPIVEISDDAEGTTANRYPSNFGRLLPSLTHFTPNKQIIPGKRYQPTFDHSGSLVDDSTPHLRRNPPRLARPAHSLNTTRRRQRSHSPLQETALSRLRTPSPLSADEGQQVDSTPTGLNAESTNRRKICDDLPPLSFETEREKRVTFQPINQESLIFEQSSLPALQRNRRVELPQLSTASDNEIESSPRHLKHRKRRAEEEKERDEVRISKEFVN